MKEGIEIGIKAVPNAKINVIEGIRSGLLKVKIAAAPDKGKANQELIKVLSKKLKIKKSFVRIIKGEKSRQKTVFFPKQDAISLLHQFFP